MRIPLSERGRDLPFGFLHHARKAFDGLGLDGDRFLGGGVRQLLSLACSPAFGLGLGSGALGGDLGCQRLVDMPGALAPDLVDFLGHRPRVCDGGDQFAGVVERGSELPAEFLEPPDELTGRLGALGDRTVDRVGLAGSGSDSLGVQLLLCVPCPQRGVLGLAAHDCGPSWLVCLCNRFSAPRELAGHHDGAIGAGHRSAPRSACAAIVFILSRGEEMKQTRAVSLARSRSRPPIGCVTRFGVNPSGNHG
ncbi:hypothetical protein ACWDYH_05440 [Nocardia goodfellowii]